jgi:deoxyhypusine synthase
MGREVTGKPVTNCEDLNEVFSRSLPAFGGAYLRRVYEVLKQVIEKRIPLVVTCAGPITVSAQGGKHGVHYGYRRDLLPRWT